MNTELMIKKFENENFITVRNQTDCLLFKKIILSSPVSNFPLEVLILDTGELQFCQLDVFLILGIIKTQDDRTVDFTTLIDNGWTSNQVDSFDHHYFINFNQLVNLCTNFTNGLKILSSVCGYLKSFGNDYFNKWYEKHLKTIRLLNTAPFTKIDQNFILNLNTSFKSENENLCGVAGDLYIIKFSTGVVKVGKSSSGPARVRQHSNEAGRYLVKVVDSYIKFGARLGEDILVEFCNKHGKLFYGKEYFKDLDFNKIKEFLINIK